MRAAALSGASAALAWLLPALPLAAGGFSLGLPVDCTLGQTCHIQHFVDRAPGPDVQDHMCGQLSYDGHNGTDFALPTLAAMESGVDVLAAAPGEVRALRDGVPDTGLGQDTAGRECGNGVVIGHRDGWETQYCHMKSGSITVQTGQQIKRGVVLGQVGFSGKTSFPHLHLALRRHGAVVDPFGARDLAECGPPNDQDLWRHAPAYAPGGLIDGGFSDAVPQFAAVAAGRAARDDLTTDAPALVAFGLGFGGRKGDVIDMTLTGPGGLRVAQSMTLEKDQPQFFRALGRKQPKTGWPPGRYVAKLRMRRGDIILDERHLELDLDP